MQKEKVIFRFSSSDFSTYLMLQGYEPLYIKVSFDKRHNRLKAFTYFEGVKADFIKLQKEYDSNNISVNPKEFSIMRKKLNTNIKNELAKYTD